MGIIEVVSAPHSPWHTIPHLQIHCATVSIYRQAWCGPNWQFCMVYFEDDPFWSARDGPRRDCCGRRLTGQTHRFLNNLGVLDYFAMPTNHDPAEVGVAFADLDHHADLRITPNVDHLLRVAVGGHVDHAIFLAIPHRHDVWEAFLIDRSKRGLVRLAEKRGLFFRGKLNLISSAHRLTSPAVMDSARSAAYPAKARIGKAFRLGVWRAYEALPLTARIKDELAASAKETRSATGSTPRTCVVRQTRQPTYISQITSRRLITAGSSLSASHCLGAYRRSPFAHAVTMLQTSPKSCRLPG